MSPRRSPASSLWSWSTSHAKKVLRSVSLDKTPRDLEFGFDGKALYFTQAGVNSVQVLDPATDRIVAQIPTGASPHIAGVYRGAPAGTA